MLAHAAVKLKTIAPQISASLAPRLVTALRETCDRLLPGGVLLKQLIAEETRVPALPAIADNDSSRLMAYITTARRDILAAQRLRYRVFTEEYGARFDGISGIDRDRFDKHCRHVVVKDTLTGQVVGYTRVLTDERARKTGGWYSAGEFDLDMVSRLDGRVLEIGRTCVHPDYRNGATIGVLWGRLAQLLLDEGFTWMFGCASIPLGDAGAGAMLEAMALREETAATFRVSPLVKLPPQQPLAPAMADSTRVKIPPLLRTYLAMGAKVCGQPCWDPDFNCADLFILVDVNTIPLRYVRHFMARRADNPGVPA
ncbi:MAG: GNAT family N-acetyltransferase [Pseudomonadota bacterium]